MQPTIPAGVPEEWRPVVGWPKYEVSNLGRVRSLYFREKKRVVPYFLSQTKHPYDGYPIVGFGATRKFAVHILVCMAFHGPRPPGYECAHEDGVPWNNLATNLSWKTQFDNNRDKIRHGTAANGERIAQHVLTAADVLEIRSRDPETLIMHRVAKEFGVAPATIFRLLRGASWRHLLPKKSEAPAE